MNRIDGPGFGQNKPSVTRTADAPSHQPTTAAPASSSDVTSTTTFDRVLSSANAQPEVNVENVARIKQAIANGEYHIDPERVAKAFTDLEGFL